MKFGSLTIILLLLFGVLSVAAQNKQAIKFAKTITIDDLNSRLSVLAADSLEGRDTGSKGGQKAAQFIADHFREIGLDPVSIKGQESYLQHFNLYKGSINEVYLKKADQKKLNLKDFLYYSRSETFGEEYIQVIYADSIEDPNLDLEGKYIVFKTQNNEWENITEQLKDRKPAGFMIINENDKEYAFMLKRFGSYFNRPVIRTSFNNESEKVLMVNPPIIEWMFDISISELRHGMETQLIFNADMHIEPLKTANVLGFLPGKEKREEAIVITSHYDHVGIIKGEIHNGADDDGSGTTAVMEIAEAFAAAAKKGNGPKRSILFMCVTGEEKGLLGSEYYTNNPVFSLENTVTNLNIDMIGRVDPKYEEEGNPNYVYVIGSDKLSQELHELSETVNTNTEKLTFDYTYNDENDPNRFYYRSDHYNFAKHNIPIIFYFNGTHADYHKPTDTIEKINFNSLQKRTRLIYYTAWEIANREGRIKADK
jgi:hypothetical protein